MYEEAPGFRPGPRHELKFKAKSRKQFIEFRLIALQPPGAFRSGFNLHQPTMAGWHVSMET